MMRSFAFRLIPTKQQESYFWKASGAARYIYNWALEQNEQAYNTQGLHISGYDMCKLLTKLKKQPDHQWLNEIHNKTLKVAVLDCEDAFQRFFNKQNGYPRKKSRKYTEPSFYIETSIQNKGMTLTPDGTLIEKLYNRIQFFYNNTVQLSGIGRVQLSNNAKSFNLPYLTEHNIPVSNGRIKYDGEHWNLTFSLDIPKPKKKEITDEILGIDLGLKNTAICSNNKAYKNINKTSKHIKKLEKRKKRLQRQIARKYEQNKVPDPTKKSGYRRIKTNNIKKVEKQTASIDRKLANIRKNYNHHVSKYIINQNPRAIVMENLNIKGMMKNRHVSHAFQQQNLYQLKTFIKYKAESQGTVFIEAPQTFKSTQTCNCCGATHHMDLNQRTYICDKCGYTEDRDINAAYNLRDYGKQKLGIAI